MNRTAHVTLAALAVSGLVSLAAVLAIPASAAGLTPLRQRITDEAIARDLARIDSVQARAVSAGDPLEWRTVRAHYMLVAAGTAYLDDDPTGFTAAAYAEAESLADAVERDRRPLAPGDVPTGGILPGSTKVRPDLWDALEAMKHGDGFPCAQRPLAHAEVELLYAGHEQVLLGDCQASPHLAAAEKALDEARALVAACQPVNAEPKPIVVEAPKPAPVVIAPSEPVAPVAAAPTAEELRIPRNVHFALDKYYLSATSKDVIAGVVKVLAKYPSITVRLEGHTDSRASVAYNLRLSSHRVNSVASYLRELGIAPARITTTFKGKSELKVTEDSKANFARNRRVEMVFVDSEGRDIQAEDQESDLQLEGDKNAHRATPAKHVAPAKRTHRTVHRRR